MKRIVQAVFLLVSALAFGFAVYYIIQGRSGAAAAARPVATRRVVAESAAGGDSARADDGKAETASRIPAQPNEVILSVAAIDLDADEVEEQLLTVRKTDEADGRLWVVEAYYSEEKKEWERAWEGETLSTKLTTFTAQVKDLVGDRGLELVCTGMNDEGEQTITVFRPEGASRGYKEILSIAADSIQIAETERSEAYQAGQAKGEAWPVLSFSRDKDSQNLLDQVKDRYAWDPKAGRYQKLSSERIPGAQIEREIVSKVLTGSEKDFEDFLEGVWYDSSASPLDPSTRLIQFDKGARLITFSRPEAQETYRWTESHPTRYGLYARSVNESVDDLVRLMDIELTGADKVSVRVFEERRLKSDVEDRWDGDFRKLPSEAPRPAQAQAPSPAPSPAAAPGTAAAAAPASAGRPRGLGASSLRLEGSFRSRDGLEIVFTGSRYSLASPYSGSESGGCYLYALGTDDALDLVAIRPDGLPSLRKTYRATLEEIKSGKDTLRRLTLSPARTSVRGLELTDEGDLVLEQRVKG
jgi:hypothetical protein